MGWIGRHFGRSCHGSSTGICLVAGYRFLFVILIDPKWSRLGLIRSASRLIMYSLFVVIPMGPQILINESIFNTATPLPASNLQGAQLQWGKENVKYATRRYDGASSQLFYVNPFYDLEVTPSDDPVEWYLSHPLDAIATIATKFVAIFDFDFIEPYIYHPYPPLQMVFRLFSLGLLFLGLNGIFARLFGIMGVSKDGMPRSFPFLILLGWSAVTLLSAPELRFSLAMFPVLIICTVQLIGSFEFINRRRILMAILVTVVGVCALYSIAQFSRQSLPNAGIAI